MKRYWYKVIDKLDKSKEIGSGNLNDLILPFGQNIIYLLR